MYAEARQQLLQRTQVEWLHEVPIKAGVSRPLDVVGLSPAGQGDRGESSPPCMAPQRLADFVTVASAESNVEMRHVRPSRFRHPKRLSAIMRSLGDASKQLQQHRERGRGVNVVVDNQNVKSGNA